MSGQKWAQERAQRSLLSAPEFWVRRSRSRSQFFPGAALALPHLFWVRRSERRTQERALCNTLTVIFAVCLDYYWSFSPTFLCGDDKIMSEYWWSERIFRRRCALGRAGLDLSCLACHSLRLLSDSIVDPWRVQAYQWRRVCVPSGVNSRQSHHSSYFIFRIFIDFFLSCFIYQIWVKARNIFITQIG